MTLTQAPPSSALPAAASHRDGAGTAVVPAVAGRGAGPERPIRPPSPGRAVVLGLMAVGVLVVAIASVIYGIGPLIAARDQRILQNKERAAIVDTAGENNGPLSHIVLPTVPPVPGSAVGILVIPAVRGQWAVVEGAGPDQTIQGIGHVPGTAGLGQPGNAAVVGRRNGYGGPFGNLADLRPGDRIVTATIEGQSVYRVVSVRQVTLTASTTTGVFGPSTHNQLTLVTSSSDLPWNTGGAVVVVARMQGLPYEPTPQESMSPNQLGNSGDGGALAGFILALLAVGALLVGAVALYRRSSTRSAYLLTTAPLIACTVLAAEAATRLLPAWL